MTNPPICVCGHDISKHNLHGCFDNPTVTSGCGCSRPPQQVSIDAHLDGTGHATLAEMRREFDAMRAEVVAARIWEDARLFAATYPISPYKARTNLDAARKATDDARPRPKEPTC